MYYLIFILILNFIMCTCFYHKNKILLSRINIFKSSDDYNFNRKIFDNCNKFFNNNSFIRNSIKVSYSDIKLINFDSFDLSKPFYFIIGDLNIKKNYITLNDIADTNIPGIFVSKSCYSSNNLKNIFENFLIDASKIKDDEILVFNENGYIGGTFELYSYVFQ